MEFTILLRRKQEAKSKLQDLEICLTLLFHLCISFLSLLILHLQVCKRPESFRNIKQMLLIFLIIFHSPVHINSQTPSCINCINKRIQFQKYKTLFIALFRLTGRNRATLLVMSVVGIFTVVINHILSSAGWYYCLFAVFPWNQHRNCPFHSRPLLFTVDFSQ